MKEARGSYLNLQSSIYWNVDHFVALNVAISGVPGYGESGDGRVGHLHVAHSGQRHWEREKDRR